MVVLINLLDFSLIFLGILLEHVIQVISLVFSDQQLQKKIYYGGIGFLLFLSIARFVRILTRILSHSPHPPTTYIIRCNQVHSPTLIT